MSEDFLENLANRLIEGRADSDREQLLQQARTWILGCNPLHGADLIDRQPLPVQLAQVLQPLEQPAVDKDAVARRAMSKSASVSLCGF